MASQTYTIHFNEDASLESETKEVKAEDFRVIDSAVVFYRHIMGDKANTHLFRLEDIASIELNAEG